MKCPHCSQEHPDTFLFCPTTGKRIEVLKACTNKSCSDFGKNILPLDSVFCPNWGCKIEETSLYMPKENQRQVSSKDISCDRNVRDKIFKCSICGYVYKGKTAPGNCPVCYTPKWTFGGTQYTCPSKYKCCVCGYVFKEESIPEKCPICKAPSSKFIAL